MTLDELTRDYMSLRREREKLATQFKQEDGALQEAQAVIESKLLELCAEHNLNPTM